ncbi:MAG: hypothetical protein ACE5IK_08070 [Acidobacteriota bacterium]
MRPSRPGWPRSLWVLTAAAFGLRLAAWLAAGPIRCLADECFYTQLATALATGKGFQLHAGHYWPPGHIAFLAAHIKMGLGVYGAKGTQVVLSTLLVPLTFVLGRLAATGWDERLARRAGLAAAALIAFNPTLIAYAHYLWSETLFLPLFIGAMILALGAGESGSSRQAAFSGMLFGLACLIKVVPLYFVPVIAVWMSWRTSWQRRPVRTALSLIGGLLLVIGPWAMRNKATYGTVVLIETTTGKNLVRGNNPVGPANWDWGSHRQPRGVLNAVDCRASNGPAALNACFTRHGLDAITGHPLRFLADIPVKIADLVNPTSFLVRHVRRGIYGDWPAPLATAVVVSVASFNMVLMGLGVIGWIGGPRGSPRTLMLLYALYTVGVHVVMFAMSRFRLPLVPLLAVGAALVLTGGARRILFPGSRVSRWVAAVIVMGLVLAWSARIGWLFALPRGDQSSGGAPLSRLVPDLRVTTFDVPRITARLAAFSARVGPGITRARRPAGELSHRRARQTRFSSPTARDSTATPAAQAPSPAGRATAGAFPWQTATTRPTTSHSSSGPRSKCRMASPLVT